MRKFILDKLVRDGVFAEMLESGQRVEYTILDDEAALVAGKAKAIEEIGEFDPEAPNGGELADALEAIENLGILSGFSFEALRAMQLAKRQKTGGFAGKIYVASVTMADDDAWAAYYASHPERFPETAVE